MKQSLRCASRAAIAHTHLAGMVRTFNPTAGGYVVAAGRGRNERAPQGGKIVQFCTFSRRSSANLPLELGAVQSLFAAKTAPNRPIVVPMLSHGVVQAIDTR